MIASHVVQAVSPLPSGYRELLEKVVVAVERDDRFRALWLSGSLARGAADAGSDLDVVVAVRDEDFDAYVATWRDWLASITPTLIARELPGATGIFYSTTDACLRLDVVAERVTNVATSNHRYRLVVVDKDGLDDLVPSPPPAAGPDADHLNQIAEEFYRRVAIFPAAVVARRDWLLGVEGIQGHRRMLYDAFVEVNQPLPPMGLKQFTAKLTPDQRKVLEGLPPVEATAGSVIAGMRATVDAWESAGRRAFESAGGTWPTELAQAARAYFDRGLT